jgi:hypothetical protein
MNAEKQVLKQLPGFEARPYGARLKINSATQLVIIAPHTNTAAGIEATNLDKDGLRGHPGEAKEMVQFLGFVGDKQVTNTKPLLYHFRDRAGAIATEGLTPGSVFDSVSGNGSVGFWHVLENVSDTPIMLMITVTPMEEVELRK